MAKKHGQSIGIETKIQDHPILDTIGFYYESWRRTSLNWLQQGLTESEVEKKLQLEFNLQWAWADSIATEAKQTFDQLTTAKKLHIEQIKQRIKAKTKKAKQVLKTLEKRIRKPLDKSQIAEAQRSLGAHSRGADTWGNPKCLNAPLGEGTSLGRHSLAEGLSSGVSPGVYTPRPDGGAGSDRSPGSHRSEVSSEQSAHGAYKLEGAIGEETSPIQDPRSRFPRKTAPHQAELEIQGLKSKVLKISSLKKELKQLEETSRLHICFGSRKLFKAQYYLEENNYQSHQEWLEDWKKKRSGRFYCIGKSQNGGGTMIKAFPLDDDGKYKLILQIPRPLQSQLGKTFELEFELDDRDNRYRKSDFNYALNTQKPLTTQIFRREHKNEQWYVHFTTYVKPIPLVHSLKNGCLGLDFNKDTISATYVKPDGNIAKCIEFPFRWQGLTTGQRQALMRDIVKNIVSMAESLGCAIAIESLDFAKKKASMSEESALYNSMLSNLSTALFRTTLESRCQRLGVELIKVNPAFTSLIGMIKFMAQSGLNSGTAAAMAIARRAMRMSESLPSCLEKPEDSSKHIWSAWNRIARYIRANRITRTQLFQWMKALEGILSNQEHLPSLSVNIEMGESKILTNHRELSV